MNFLVSNLPIGANLKLVYNTACSSVHYHNLIFLVKYNILNLENISHLSEALASRILAITLLLLSEDGVIVNNTAVLLLHCYAWKTILCSG